MNQIWLCLFLWLGTAILSLVPIYHDLEDFAEDKAEQRKYALMAAFGFPLIGLWLLGIAVRLFLHELYTCFIKPGKE